MRLAGPDSGTSTHERSSAALEAARLYHEHGLAVQEAEKPEPRRRAPKAPRKRGHMHYGSHSRSGPSWIMSVATSEVYCEDCGGEIGRNENVWMRTDGSAYVHRPIYT